MVQHPHADARTWILEIGGSHVTAAALDATLGIARRVTAPLDGAAPRDALLDAIAGAARTLARDEAPSPAGARWAVAIPGPFDYDAGIGRFAGVGKFESLRGVDVRGELARRLGTAPDGVRFLNDAHAYGIGEWAFGESGRVDRLVCITLGTGVGSAFLRAGDPVAAGRDVPPGGEAFRLTIDGAPLEDTVSARAMSADFARRTGHRATVREIASLADGGDAHAAAVLDRAMRALGAALAPWLTSFAAHDLVVGGSMSRSWHLLQPPLTAGVAAGGARDVAIRPSTLLDDAPLLGAGTWLQRQAAPASDHER